MPIKIQEAYRTSNRLVHKGNSSCHIIIQTPKTQNKEILKAAKEMDVVTCKGRPIRITPDFSVGTLKARKAWAGVLQTVKDHRRQPSFLYPTKLSVTVSGENKIFQDKVKFRQHLSTNPGL